MNTLEAIHTRRSIRKFTDDPVTGEQAETLLRAAMAAPSANNEQAWAFVEIRDRGRLDEIMEAHPFATMLATAPLAIAVLGDTSRELHPGYWPLDCSAAAQNILLAAHELGLGAVWLGVHPREERILDISRILSLPAHLVPHCLIAAGHPAETKNPAERFDPDRVFRESFENGR
jgi:nitroreductase